MGFCRLLSTYPGRLWELVKIVCRGALLHESLRRVSLSLIALGASMRNNAESNTRSGTRPELCNNACATKLPGRQEGPVMERNSKRDGGGPFKAALQREALNNLKLRWLRARVVSVKEKAS